MRTGHLATFFVRAWKEHTCIGCGSRYRYPMAWRQHGLAGSPEAAVAAAREAAVQNLRKNTQMLPCPLCGRYQPEMVEKRRALAYAITFWATMMAPALSVVCTPAIAAIAGGAGEA